MRRPDPAHLETEKRLRELEARIAKEYEQAAKEVQEKLYDYLRRFEKKDKKWRQWVREGKETKEDWLKWRQAQILEGKRWQNLRDQLAEEMLRADKLAKDLIEYSKPEIYAINHNYGTFEAETGSGIDTSFTLYNREAVERILLDNPEMLPPPGKKVSKAIAEGAAKRWNNQHLQSAMIQGILQGESIPKLATRAARAVGESNRKAAIRNARTMATGAQNAGRIDAYKRAEALGIEMRQTWMATLDMRTRHEHRQMDGQTVKVGEPFKIDGYKLRFPGDPEGPAHLVYNCRCTVIGQVKGVEIDITKTDIRSKEALEGMNYEEWKQSKVEKPRDILSQEKTGQAMKARYIRRYRDG